MSATSVPLAQIVRCAADRPRTFAGLTVRGRNIRAREVGFTRDNLLEAVHGTGAVVAHLVIHSAWRCVVKRKVKVSALYADIGV